MDIAQGISHFFVGAGLLLSSFLGHNDASSTANATEPSVAVQKESTVSAYTASGNLSYQDYDIKMNISIPKNGGEVTGDISGDCTGKITGQYDGKDNGVISGEADGSCRLLFLQIPGKVTFNGTVNKSESLVNLLVTAKIDSFEKSRNVTFSFH